MRSACRSVLLTLQVVIRAVTGLARQHHKRWMFNDCCGMLTHPTTLSWIQLLPQRWQGVTLVPQHQIRFVQCRWWRQCHTPANVGCHVINRSSDIR